MGGSWELPFLGDLAKLRAMQTKIQGFQSPKRSDSTSKLCQKGSLPPAPGRWREQEAIRLLDQALAPRHLC